MPDTASPAPPGFHRVESGLLLPVDIRAAEWTGETNSQEADPWLIDWMQGGSSGLGYSHAGLWVTPQRSLALSAYYDCIRIIAEDCAKLPLDVLERLPRGRRPAPDHPLWPILHAAFNEEMTSMTAREVMTAHAVGWGNGYGLIIRDRTMTQTEGTITGIYPLHPSRVRPRRDLDTGELVYEIFGGQASWRDPLIPLEILPANDIVHIKGLGPDGLIGYSIAQLAAESLGLSLAAQTYGASFFGESAIPSGILRHPKALTELAKKNLRASWEARKHGTAVLEEGIEFQQLTIPPEQAQFLETRLFQVREICRWFRMPPHKVADLADAHHTNIEAQNIEYVSDTLMPWLTRWEQELDRKILGGADDSQFYCRHDVRGLLRGDSAARAAYYKSLFSVAALSPNDIRELEDEEPYDGGDSRFLQIQYAPVDQIVNGTAAKPRQGPVSPSDMAARVNGHRNGHTSSYVGTREE